jgi:predicted nucleotidyltransferase
VPDEARIAAILERLASALRRRADVRFAFLHGSVLTRDDAHDVDVAVWLDRAEDDRLAHEHRLSRALAADTALPIDVQILNGAPVGVLHQVFRGRLAFARDEAEVTDRIEQIANEALAFSHHRAEYLDALTS